MLIYIKMDSLIIFCAKYLIAVIPLLALAAWLQAGKKLKKQMLLAAVAAVILAVILDKIAGKLYYDPRPFVSNHLKPLVAHAADNGFPSEHALFGTALATLIYIYRPRVGTVALAAALVVGIARVAAHIHSPIDIITGFVIGIAAGFGGYAIARRLLSPKAD
jgi:undecaprenyl-diphosphatase